MLSNIGFREKLDEICMFVHPRHRYSFARHDKSNNVELRLEVSQPNGTTRVRCQRRHPGSHWVCPGGRGRQLSSTHRGGWQCSQSSLFDIDGEGLRGRKVKRGYLVFAKTKINDNNNHAYMNILIIIITYLVDDSKFLL